MTYNPEELKEVKKPKPGERVDGKVSEVKEGIIRDLVDSEFHDKWKESLDDAAIQVVCEASNGENVRSMIVLPKDGQKVHFRSKLANWKEAFGDYPTVGQDVYLNYNSEGWLRLPWD